VEDPGTSPGFAGLSPDPCSPGGVMSTLGNGGGVGGAAGVQVSSLAPRRE
jgi:hypothetical protein